MKTLCGIAVVGLVLLLGGASAQAWREDQHDGNRLLAMCRDYLRFDEAGGRATAQGNYNAGYCQGFVVGLIEMHEGARSTGPQPLRPFFCLPPGEVTWNQTVRVYVRYLETHPARLHLDQRDLLIEALSDAFPCSPAASLPQR